MTPRHDEYYLRDVTALGDSRRVVTHAPIYTPKGIKLVDVGTRITGELFEKLVRHKLLPPIDQCVTAEDAVDPGKLVVEARRLIGERPFLSALAGDQSGAERLVAPLSQMTLEPPLAFKLTVMESRRPALYTHSVEVALIAIFLGQLTDAAPDLLRALAAAGMFHDIGEMHIDRAILDSAQELTHEERRHIYAHPVTAYLILKDYVAYATEVGNAVVAHHEREDGSGYPRGIRAGQTTPLGQILALAEVVGSMIRKLPADDDLSRIGVALRLYAYKYDPALVARLYGVFRSMAPLAVDSGAQAPAFLSSIERLGSVIGNWQAIYETLVESGKRGALAASIDSRVREMERALSDAGCHPDQLRLAYDGARDNPGALAEMAELAEEAVWQFRDIMRATRRHWKNPDDADLEQHLIRRWSESSDVVLSKPAEES